LKKKQNKEVRLNQSGTSQWQAGPNKPLELPSVDISLAFQTGNARPSLTSERLPSPVPRSSIYPSQHPPAPMPAIEVPVALYVLGNPLPPYVALRDAGIRVATAAPRKDNPSIPEFEITIKHQN
jgi:hypothetical protein